MRASSFYYLLNEGYKLQAEEEMISGITACLPHMTEGARSRFFRENETCQRDIINIGKENTDYSGLETLKKELNK